MKFRFPFSKKKKDVKVKKASSPKSKVKAVAKKAVKKITAKKIKAVKKPVKKIIAKKIKSFKPKAAIKAPAVVKIAGKAQVKKILLTSKIPLLAKPVVMRPMASPRPAALPPAPKLSSSPYSKKDLDFFEKRLVAEKEKILKALDFDKDLFEDLMHNDHEIGDLVDKAFNQYEKDRAIDISEKEKRTLKEINAALQRIQNNTFGICIKTGRPIEKDRLDALPWTQVSIAWARSQREEIRQD